MKTTELDIGMLCQWLNEERITDSKKMVTDWEIKHWLDTKDKEYSLTATAVKDKPTNKTAKTILVVFALGIVVSIVAIFVLLNYVGII